MFRASFRKVSNAGSLLAVRAYKKTIEQLAKEKPGLLKDAKVLVRVDFNVPLSKTDASVITDDTRIREALPTINFLTKAGAKVMLASHCGRPKGQVNDKMRMAPMAKRLAELIKMPVHTVGDCIGADVDSAVAKLQGGEVLMLENARFYKEEEKNDPGFAEKLAKNATIFVNDAFGTAHRAHASTEGVCKFVDHKVAGFLLEKELVFLQGAVDTPKRPFAAVVGGAKVSTKIPVIESLIEKCDKIFVGGGMIFTFYRAMGLNVGNSMVEEEFIPMAKSLMEKAKAKGVKFYLPTDVIVADEFKADANSKNVSVKEMPEGWMGLDIGSESLATFKKELLECNTVVWNGPMGVFEFEKFSQGTFGVAHTLAEVTKNGGITIIGGGDSVAAVNAAKLVDQMSHISTGGGASLEMLEGKVLPGVASLDNA
ncbi:phosphoglycerate kinase [Ochromonadaceae sp. CCMP2298]|nr:phosphoglycerate kinase [Ochromonadaceae sp. CCMP2298]